MAFGEPAGHWSEEIAGLVALAPIMQEPCQAHFRTEFEGSRLLLARDCKRTLERRLHFRCIRLRRPERVFASVFWCSDPSSLIVEHGAHALVVERPPPLVDVASLG